MPAVRHSPGPRRDHGWSRANHDQQAIVFTCQDPACLMALVVDAGPCRPDRVLRQQLGRVGSASMAKARMTEFKTAIWSYLCCACVRWGTRMRPSRWEQTGSRLIAVVENDCHYLGVCLKCKRNEIARRRWGKERWRGTAAKAGRFPREEARQSQDKEGISCPSRRACPDGRRLHPCRCASRGLRRPAGARHPGRV